MDWQGRMGPRGHPASAHEVAGAGDPLCGGWRSRKGRAVDVPPLSVLLIVVAFFYVAPMKLRGAGNNSCTFSMLLSSICTAARLAFIACACSEVLLLLGGSFKLDFNSCAALSLPFKKIVFFLELAFFHSCGPLDLLLVGCSSLRSPL